MPSSHHSARYRRLTELLVTARKEAGLAQMTLSARLNRPQSYVSKYENGERRLDLIEFLEVTEAIGCSYEKIVAQIIGSSRVSK